MATQNNTTLQGARLVRSRAITSADANTTALVIDVPANTWVPPYGVNFIVNTLFAGGTPSFTVGDGDDVDGWLVSADITEATVGAYASAAAAYAIAGKYYTAADTIDVVVSTGLTSGNGYVMATMVDMSDLV